MGKCSCRQWGDVVDVRQVADDCLPPSLQGLDVVSACAADFDVILGGAQ